MTVVVLVTVFVLWSYCLLSLAEKGRPEDMGRVSPGHPSRLRGIEGGRRG